jgi:hypothetical protein
MPFDQDDPIMRSRPAWSAAVNGVNYSDQIGRSSINCGSMGPATAAADLKEIEDRVRKYLMGLEGLELTTIPISAICEDLGMTEDAVTRILTRWGILLDEMDVDEEWIAPPPD